MLPIVTNTPSSERLLENLTASSKEALEEVRGEIPALEEGWGREKVALLTSGGLWHYST